MPHRQNVQSNISVSIPVQSISWKVSKIDGEEATQTHQEHTHTHTHIDPLKASTYRVYKSSLHLYCRYRTRTKICLWKSVFARGRQVKQKHCYISAITLPFYSTVSKTNKYFRLMCINESSVLFGICSLSFQRRTGAGDKKGFHFEPAFPDTGKIWDHKNPQSLYFFHNNQFSPWHGSQAWQ